MNRLNRIINEITSYTTDASVIEPLIIDEDVEAQEFAEELKKHNIMFVDDSAEQTSELKQLDGNDNPEFVYAYFPWKRAVVKILNKDEFEYVRESRNRNLITEDEQATLTKKRIAIAGLNVGNPAALCLAQEGAMKNVVMADNDPLSLSNLNRFRAGLCDLGINKAVLSARQIKEVNPYAEVEVYKDGIDKNNQLDFLLEPKVDVLIEEMDQLPLKISMRQHAKQHGIPVVMVTGNAENAILDIERYDLDPELEILNGLLPEHVKTIATDVAKLQKLNTIEKAQLARDFMGADILRPRLVESFSEVGKSLISIPQLAESSSLRGGVVCYAVRNILLGNELPSGRYFLNVTDLTS